MRSDDCVPTFPSGPEPECFTHAGNDPACNLQLERALEAAPILDGNSRQKVLRGFTAVDREPQGVVGRAYARGRPLAPWSV